jgi:hypothetical protein
MTKVEIINKITRTLHKGLFQLKKHSPEILVVGGVVGTVVAGVMACKATTKVDAILAKAKQDVEGVHRVKEDPELAKLYVQEYGEEYTDAAMKKDLTVVYAKTGLELVKTYAPSVAVAAVSITAILAGNNILRQRAVAYAAAFTSVDNSFKEYRERVVERFGKDLDKELRYNIKAQEVTEIVVNEDGTEETVTTTVQTMNPSEHDEFTRCFDETCEGWCRNAEHNLGFLMQQQRWCNERLQKRGYLSLNDVYESLGMQKTGIGQVMGWVYDPKNPELQNVVDFGIHDLHDEQKRAFVNGYEKSIWVNFNVDGNLTKLIP